MPALREKFSSYITDVWFLWALCLIFNIITFLFIYFKIHPTNKTLALHYNILVGVVWYGNGKNLYFIPGIGLVITGANYTLFRAFRDQPYFLPFLTAFVSLCVQIILFVAALFLARVN